MPSDHTPQALIADLTDRAISGYHLLQIPSEFAGLLQVVHDARPRTVVEIGAFSGASIWAMGQVCDPDTLLITVDITDVNLPIGPFADQIRIPTRVWRLPRPVLSVVLHKDNRVHYRVIGDSTSRGTRQLVESLLKIHGRQAIDVLFIDGDHTLKGVTADFDLFSPLVREGGVVAFHDIMENEIMRAKDCYVGVLWNDLKVRPGWHAEEIKDTSDTLYSGNPAWKVFGIGVLRKQPGTSVEAPTAPLPHLCWFAYRLGHTLNMSIQYLIHVAGWFIKRLLGRKV